MVPGPIVPTVLQQMPDSVRLQATLVLYCARCTVELVSK